MQNNFFISKQLWQRLCLAAMVLLLGLLRISPAIAEEVALNVAAPSESVYATPFLTLPYSDPAVEIQQGYICHWESCEETYPELVHGGIDYILRATPYYWTTFDVVAAADGTAACFPPSGGYGYHVLITHDILGAEYTTLYAHLSNCEAFAEEASWESVTRGAIIGEVLLDEASYETHLHFAVYLGSATSADPSSGSEGTSRQVENILGAIYSPPTIHTLLIDPYNQYNTLNNGIYNYQDDVATLWLTGSPSLATDPMIIEQSACNSSNTEFALTIPCTHNNTVRNATLSPHRLHSIASFHPASNSSPLPQTQSSA